MTLPDINPIQFWPVTATAFDHLSATLKLLHSSFAVTFNSEAKNEVLTPHCYFHVVKSNDVLVTEFIVDNTAQAYVLSGRNQDGSLWQNFNFAQISGAHFRVTVDLNVYPAIADTKIFFAIINSTTGKVIAISDHQNVKTTVIKSVLSTYSNDIPYDGVLANVQMKLRLPAMFVFGQFPEETETEGLTDGTIVNLSGTLKTQRILQLVTPVPDYIHKKIKLILKCSDISIANLNWKQEEAYEIEDINIAYEMRRGKVVLTQDGSVVRNVYAP